MGGGRERTEGRKEREREKGRAEQSADPDGLRGNHWRDAVGDKKQTFLVSGQWV